MFALADANNFYVSCERIFQPKLEGKPVIVLSNNDGCAIARSNEAKALGIPMGAPWFQLKELAKKHGIIALSSNYALYGDMSNRVVQVLRMYSPKVEVYSIDESFLELDGLAGMWGTYGALGHALKDQVRMWTGIPVGVGIGPTKTLAKLANHLAKKRSEFNGVCDLSALTKVERRVYYASLDVGQVWGVGRRTAEKLQALGIDTVDQLRSTPPQYLRQQFGVVMERTGNELRGISCIEYEDVAPPKKQIVSSRSFGRMVTDLEELQEAVSTYAWRATEKLRREGSVCSGVHVFVETNRFREQDRQYNNGMNVTLSEPTDDVRRITGAALYGLKRIFLDGFLYKKAGVMLLDLSPSGSRQGALFLDFDPHSSKLMDAMSEINIKFGKETVRLASSGAEKPWAAIFEHKTPRYTTRWDEVPKASF
jgi:DNA polymerase V